MASECGEFPLCGFNFLRGILKPRTGSCSLSLACPAVTAVGLQRKERHLQGAGSCCEPRLEPRQVSGCSCCPSQRISLPLACGLFISAVCCILCTGGLLTKSPTPQLLGIIPELAQARQSTRSYGHVPHRTPCILDIDQTYPTCGGAAPYS